MNSAVATVSLNEGKNVIVRLLRYISLLFMLLIIVIIIVTIIITFVECCMCRMPFS